MSKEKSTNFLKERKSVNAILWRVEFKIDPVIEQSDFGQVLKLKAKLVQKALNFVNSEMFQFRGFKTQSSMDVSGWLKDTFEFEIYTEDVLNPHATVLLVDKKLKELFDKEDYYLRSLSYEFL